MTDATRTPCAGKVLVETAHGSLSHLRLRHRLSEATHFPILLLVTAGRSDSGYRFAQK